MLSGLLNNPLALLMLTIMIILLIVIGVLANILIGAAEIKLKKTKNQTTHKLYSVLLLAFMLSGTLSHGQEPPKVAVINDELIGGMPKLTFYLMAGSIFLEMGIVIGLLVNIKMLIRVEKEKMEYANEAILSEEKKNRLSWWDRFNKLRPVSQEADLDLGHEYDGIRELNNKLPPWWLYGFYVSIVFAVIYLWRFHVSHTAPSSEEEYAISIVKADLEIKKYLALKGEAVDENTVTVLTSPDDLAEGKQIFIKSCASCHTESGAGNVGPNLTDDFWLHGHDIKSIFKTIRYGINAMPQWQNSYSNKQLAQVASYVKSLHGTNPPNAKAPQGIEAKEEVSAVSKDSISVQKQM